MMIVLRELYLNHFILSTYQRGRPTKILTKRYLRGVCAASLMLLLGPNVLAETANYYDSFQSSKTTLVESKVKKGCEYEEVDIQRYGLRPFANPAVVSSEDGVLTTTLTVEYAEHNIGGCDTHLRTYNGERVGPTLKLKPGDTLRIKLKNNLPNCDPDDPERCGHSDGQGMNTPGNFNITNLHTHGFHVSPAGNSDNVLLQIKPGIEFDYEIKVPANHPAGTFWYHAHVHGSTALQVSSGMAGAIVIEGGLDDLPAVKEMEDKVFVFQQVAYDCTGVIESYESDCPDGIGAFGPGEWEKMNRPILINGQIVPIITLRPGEIQRWRLIHAGVRETILLRVEDSRGYGREKLNEVAVDSLATGRMDAWPKVELQPGYRSDVLYRAPLEVGEYWLMDVEASAEQSLLGVTEPENTLAKIIVAGNPVSMNLPKPEALKSVKAMKDFTEKEIKALPETKSPMMFYLGAREDVPESACGPFERKAGGAPIFSINGFPFGEAEPRELTLNTAEKWTLCTRGLAPAHPFHIHVNPFQVERLGPTGKTQMVWRDTLLVRSSRDEVIYTRYEDYIGEFVLHCHILDHEDQGMMEIVKINLEGSTGHH